MTKFYSDESGSGADDVARVEADNAALRAELDELRRKLLVTDASMSTIQTVRGLRLNAANLPTLGTITAMGAVTITDTWPGALDVNKNALQLVYDNLASLISQLQDAGVLS